MNNFLSKKQGKNIKKCEEGIVVLKYGNFFWRRKQVYAFRENGNGVECSDFNFS